MLQLNHLVLIAMVYSFTSTLSVSAAGATNVGTIAGTHVKKLVLPDPQQIPHNTKPLLPLALSIHHTRYYGGCFHHTDANFSAIAPWVFNFDYLVTSCGVNWNSPGESTAGDTCVFTWLNLKSPESLYASDTRPWQLKRENNTVLIHVHSDPRHQYFFVDKLLPVFERNEAILNVTLHTGGGDQGPFGVENRVHDYTRITQRLLSSKVVTRWVVEQSRIHALASVDKVMFLPTGLCEREFDQEHGGDLVYAIHHTIDDGDTSMDRRRQLEAAIEHAKPWLHRKDRVLFCFGGGWDSRVEWNAYAKNCSICDVCQHAHGQTLTHVDLWKLYGEYKYIASPYGNGPDCGRSWEILLLGAVPIIEYFVGAEGYNRGMGNGSVILVRNVTEINHVNVTQWDSSHAHGVDAYKLTHEYWSRRAFQRDM